MEAAAGHKQTGRTSSSVHLSNSTNWKRFASFNCVWFTLHFIFGAFGPPALHWKSTVVDSIMNPSYSVWTQTKRAVDMGHGQEKNNRIDHLNVNRPSSYIFEYGFVKCESVRSLLLRVAQRSPCRYQRTRHSEFTETAVCAFFANASIICWTVNSSTCVCRM